MRIDAHQHYWSLRRGDYTWLNSSDTALYRDFLPAELRGTLADCGIRATVLVQAAATEAETRFLFDLAQRHSSIAGVVGWVDFEAADVRNRIRRLQLDGGGKLKGFRPMVQDIPDPDWLARDSLDTAFNALCESELVFDALVLPIHFGALAQRLRKHPTLCAVLDHAGKPEVSPAGFAAWSRQIAQISRIDNLHCKLSGLLTQFPHTVDAQELKPFVEHIFACFGGERVLWGSDWPVSTLRVTYRDWLDMSSDLVHEHCPTHVAAVFGSNAASLYRLEING